MSTETTEVTSEILGFADTGDSRNKILGDTLIYVSRNTSGDADVQVDFLGDFGDLTTLYPDEWFSLSIEGHDLGKFQGIQSQYTTSNLTISSSDWKNIIKDGTIGITYTMGPEVDNLDTNPNEFIKLKFSWEKSSPGEPSPTQVSGTKADDILTGTDGKNIIYGLLGNDTISAGGDNDIVKGGLGDDKINGGNHSYQRALIMTCVPSLVGRWT
ncbi:calcium-binding protein [Shinella sp. JR1-6]|uniref:calcium-binding protein n=1 Tax=Shinella sp. JR1-6 TaxID=2527671 RepID=UPI00102D3D43|nr:calcium-binding protein [Shinella sp. JR1-6]TAA51722.1 calcium-binding protein [Shinella sp. JR1-6]